MPVVKVTDLAFGRLRSPSLDQAEEFLTHFGLVRTERTRDRLYMRGTDPTPHVHITHLGPSKFLGLGFYVESEDDLARLAKAPGARGIEHIDEPGGGKRVRLADPHGYDIEVIHGQRATAVIQAVLRAFARITIVLTLIWIGQSTVRLTRLARRKRLGRAIRFEPEAMPCSAIPSASAPGPA